MSRLWNNKNSTYPKGMPGRVLFRIVLTGFLLDVIFLVVLLTLGYFAASKPLTYMPQISFTDQRTKHGPTKTVSLKNLWFTLFVQNDGNVLVKSSSGDTIMSDMLYYSDYGDSLKKWGLDHAEVKELNDSTIKISGVGQKGTSVVILATVNKKRPRLEVTINTKYNSEVVVNRESLGTGFLVPVTEVFSKNRKVNDAEFDPEYWLQRQGVRFGSGKSSALIYNTPSVSSLQLDTKKSLLLINLDYYPDHPYVNIPYQKDGGGKWIDLSKSKYKAGDNRTNNFSIFFGTEAISIPRLMLVPGGYLAAYIFSEHADGGNIRNNRAAYFGSQDIVNINDAKKGFAGHNIPVTKSIFYGDTGVPLESSILYDPEFIDFLDQLYTNGYDDICLHTPDGGNSSRPVLKESIEFMKNRFDTKSWIDHGMYSGKINREAISADGLNPDSPYYSADLLEKYGTRYLWSPAVELIRNYSLKREISSLKFYDVSVNIWKRYLSPTEIKKIGFFKAITEMFSRFKEKGELNSLVTYKGNALPTPLYWQNPTRSNNFYWWPTDYEKVYGNLTDKKVKLEQKLLKKLVSDRGVFINHGYFVRYREDVDILNVKNGKMVINPYFDTILANMELMEKKHDLLITTVRDLLDYWILTEKVSFDYLQDGSVTVINGNDTMVRGLSLAVKAKIVLVDGKIPESRRDGDDTIFWFDIPANGKVQIKPGN